jgi:succinyl-diaminopimelate desuccinylase
MINKERLIKLTRQLIAINSENPPGDESGIADFVRGYLLELGLRVKIFEFEKKRPNVLAYLEKKSNNHSLLITPHLDTVPAGKSWRFNPFSGKISGGRIYGLGATDCKCNLACSLEVIKSIIEDKKELPYNLIFAATADEESGSDLGLIPLLERKLLNPDAALVLDADDFEIIVAQKGLIHLKVRISGKKAHGAYPHFGVNAIDITADVIRELKSYRFPHKRNKYLQAPTVNVGTIKGGDKVNVVADWAEFELDFRFLPGSKAQDSLKVLRKILDKSVKRFSALSKISLKAAVIDLDGIQEPYSISDNHPLVLNLKMALKENRIKAHLRGSEGATVITFFQKRNIPAIASGFGCSGCAHIADEFVKISNLYNGAKVLRSFLDSYKF